MPPVQIQLGHLSDRHEGLPPGERLSCAEAASLCLETSGHQQGVLLVVSGSMAGAFTVQWQAVTESVRRGHADLGDAAERGACCVASHVIEEFTELDIRERSCKGTGFDYWLGERQDNGVSHLFQSKARLEVSGILRETGTNTVPARLARKLAQPAPSDATNLPAYAVVVEFSSPKSLTGAR